LTYIGKWQIMLFKPRQPLFLSVWASCRTAWMWTGSLRRLSGPQALQIWTHWTMISGTPYWKSSIKSSWSLRRLMSWKSPCRPSGKSCHKNTSTRHAYTPDCLHGCGCQWWSLQASAVALSISKVCISSPTNWILSEPPTDYPWRQHNTGDVLLEIGSFCHFSIYFNQTWS